LGAPFAPPDELAIEARAKMSRKELLLWCLALVAIFAFLAAVSRMFELSTERAQWLDAALVCAIALAFVLHLWWRDR
jgi:uncharacterized membrane protein YhaH (DUF805 family)